VADGFESFDVSQYFPNNITIMAGEESQFLYAFSHTTIRRKGSMRPDQKRKRAALEAQWRAPREGVPSLSLGSSTLGYPRSCRVPYGTPSFR
jgi:hypothetical protein